MAYVQDMVEDRKCFQKYVECQVFLVGKKRKTISIDKVTLAQRREIVSQDKVNVKEVTADRIYLLV